MPNDDYNQAAANFNRFQEQMIAQGRMRRPLPNEFQPPAPPPPKQPSLLDRILSLNLLDRLQEWGGSVTREANDRYGGGARKRALDKRIDEESK